MHVDVPSLPLDAIHQSSQAELTSTTVRQQVIATRQRQQERQGKPNARLANHELEQHCRLETDAHDLLKRALEQLGLSTRAYHRVLRLARTLADLDSQDQPSVKHVAEAIGYRRLDRDSNSHPN